MKLNKSNLAYIKGGGFLPSSIFSLPEKVLQFGTGVLLRGLPDYYIDKANRNGIFNGRVVVVKSTDKGSASDFDNQDSLYTLCIRGIEKGDKIEENIICSSISRVLVAGNEWEEILNVAASPSLEIVISNTTEVGIELIDDNIFAYPPVSYPGKLLAVLYHRYKMYNGSKDRGLSIIPTELITGNADKLKHILVELAESNDLGLPFMDWMQNYNYFCNSLVDRIVPGRPEENALKELNAELGYEDDLLTVSEVYSLWAIEGDERIQEKLIFAKADTGVIITPDINLYRELKLRLLNGTHTLSCGVAFLAGFQTVKEAMDDPDMEAFISGLMKLEIAPSIPYDVSEAVSDDFSEKVLDRFRNPHIKHHWISISMNYTSKLKIRVVPVLLKYVKLFNKTPNLIAFSFAAYIHFMKGEEENGKYYGSSKDGKYLINDDKADHFSGLWKNNDEDNIVKVVLSDNSLWETDLSLLPGFTESVEQYLKDIKADSIKSKLRKL
jgi:tagaturonate reductase